MGKEVSTDNDDALKFLAERQERVNSYGANQELLDAAREFSEETIRHQYSYNFNWLGRPIIQYPQDMVAVQELIWSVRPDLVIETGIAHGGSLILSASMLALIELSDAIESGAAFDPSAPKRKVLGIDIDIRSHNRTAIEKHPMANWIEMIQGSSIDAVIAGKVKEIAKNYARVLVMLDSNHTHDHVLAELEFYASLTSVDSYCIVFDTIVEDLPDDMYPYRPWCPGNNPKTAVHKFLETHDEFELDKDIDHKLLVTVAPDGFLKRIR